MKQWRYLALALTLSSSAVLANSMKSNFDEGRAYGGVANGNAQNVMKGFNSEQIMPNAGSPEQAKLYTGQNSNPNLAAMGIQALSNTEVGQVLTQSSINNPADTISTESDMLKRSDEIVNNAHYLTGGISGKQCIKQSLSKSHFTNHFCEKDQNITKTCKTTAEVIWKGEVKKIQKEKEIILNQDNWELEKRLHGSVVIYKYKMPYDAVIKGVDFYFRNSKGLFGLKNVRITMPNGNVHKVNYDHYDSNTISEKNMFLSLKKGDVVVVQVNVRMFSFLYKYIKEKHVENYIRLHLLVEENIDNLTYNLVYKNNCDNDVQFNSEKAIKISEQCLSSEKNRRFEQNGKVFNISADCWDKNEVYSLSDASDNECKRYDEDRNCTVGERECLSSENGLCTRFRLKYQCQHTTKTEGVVCGDKFFCSDGSCADLNGSVNADFGHAVSQLASLAQAGKDISLDAQNLRAFSGRPMACRKSGFGFSDCCKDSGWGHKAGIAHCNSEENVLGKAKEKNTVIYVGTYCSKEVLRHCVQRKSAYCVFDSKLARIIQYQGRSGQLGIGFGGAQNPDCRGLTVDELQRLNFNAMDYSDFYSELQQNTKIPNQNQIVDFIQKNIAGQLQQKQ